MKAGRADPVMALVLVSESTRRQCRAGPGSVPPEREVSEMKGKGSGKVGGLAGLAQRLGPLRRIVEVLRHADDAFGTSRVRFECGHEGSVSSGAIYKGRCRRCRPAAALPPSS